MKISYKKLWKLLIDKDMMKKELAEKAGVGLRFVRELEQGKESLRIDKVNKVLQLFGYVVGAVPDNSIFEKNKS